MPRAAAFFCALPLALSLLAGAAVAGDPRPPQTLLRPTDVPKKELVIFVGGLDGRAADPVFDRLIAGYLHDPRYEVRIFGADPEHPYDTSGPIDVAAAQLVGELREIGPRYSGIHIVAHSMGGVVVDRAFASGLSSADGVRTYTALASPHSGSLAAWIAEKTIELSGTAGGETRALLSLGTDHDLGSAAAHDLAHVTLAPPPAGVVRLDVRFANDPAVAIWDARDGRVDSRTFLPESPGELEGHGAVTADRRAMDLVRRTISDGRPPADDRGLAEHAAAFVTSVEVGAGELGGMLLVATCCVLLSVAVRGLRRPIRRWVDESSQRRLADLRR